MKKACLPLIALLWNPAPFAAPKATEAHAPESVVATATLEPADCVQSLNSADRAKIEALARDFEKIAPLRGDGPVPSPAYEAKANALLAQPLSKAAAWGLIALRQGRCDTAYRILQAKGLNAAIRGELALTPLEFQLERWLQDPVFSKDPTDRRGLATFPPHHLNYWRDRALSNMRQSKFSRYGLTDAELALIFAYSSGDFYKILNTALRQRSNNPAYYAKAMPFIDVLSSALAKLPDYKGPLQRRTTLPMNILEDYEKGYIANDPAFTSTQEPNARQQFKSEHLLRIDAQHCKAIWGYSANPDEREVLCPAGMKFLVDKVEHMETFYLHECPSGNAELCKRP